MTEKINITFKRKRPPARISPHRQRPGGLLNVRKESEYLARRKKAGNGIKFFDFGQIPNESGFSDWDIKNLTEPFFSSDTFFPYYLVDDDWFEIRDEIIAIGNLLEHSRQIEKAHSVLFQLIIEHGNFIDGFEQITLETDARFDTNILKLNSSELASDIILLKTSLESDVICLKDANGEYPVNKYTLTPDYDDDGISFTISNSDQIFIVPQFRNVRSRILTQADVPITDNNYYLNYFYKIHPRGILLDPESAYFGAVTNKTFTISPEDTEIDENDYNEFFEAVGIQKLDADVRGYYSLDDNTTIETGELDPNDFPPEYFTPPPSVPDIPEDIGAGYLLESFYELLSPPTGFLQAIVLRGNQKIYIWKA